MTVDTVNATEAEFLNEVVYAGTSIDNGVLIGLTVGDLNSAVEELKSKNV